MTKYLNDYVPVEYPKTLHGPKGATIIAKTPVHLDELATDGWRETPYPPDPYTPVGASQTPQASGNVALQTLTKELLDLQSRYADMKAELAEAVAQRDALQARISHHSAQPKVKLQQSLDDLQAKYDDLKMIHGELLSVVTTTASA
jgi:hypothetical protein